MLNTLRTRRLHGKSRLRVLAPSFCAFLLLSWQIVQAREIALDPLRAEPACAARLASLESERHPEGAQPVSGNSLRAPWSRPSVPARIEARLADAHLIAAIHVRKAALPGDRDREVSNLHAPDIAASGSVLVIRTAATLPKNTPAEADNRNLYGAAAALAAAIFAALLLGWRLVSRQTADRAHESTEAALSTSHGEVSLKLLETAIARASDMVIITEADSSDEPGPRIVFVNEAFETRTGYRKEEVLGKNPRILQGANTSRDAIERIRAAIMSGKPVREELLNYTRDGTPFWLELDIAPLADEAGRYTHWMAIGRDVTERKDALAALVASELRYRQLFESSPLPMWVYDLDTLRFLDVNDVACAHYGYTRQEFMAMTIRDIQPPADYAVPEQEDGNVGAAPLRSTPGRHLRKDGSVIKVETNSHEVLMQGRRARFECSVDVTGKEYAQEEIRRMNLLLERKVEMRTEALSHSLALQQSIFDSVPQIVWLADLGGNVTFVNRIWAEKIGITTDDWKGDGWSRALHPEDFERVTQGWRKAATSEDKFEIEYRLLHRDGGYHDYQVGARKVFAAAGEPLCWVGICADVTDSRRREDALRFANQELESFSSSVSHDLRAPLRTISGFSERLLLESAGRLDEQGRHCLDRIQAGVANMNQLIDDLLSLSQVARADMVPAKVDLSALARRVFEELRQQQPDQPMEIVIQEHMTAIGDAGLLRVVLVNLIGNALKFSGKRAVSRIEIGETALPGDMSMFFVRDNGAGFDPAYATRMFGVFQRLHSKTEFPGTGIGLATVQRIIHRHGGHVSAEGAVDQGARICFWLRRE